MLSTYLLIGAVYIFAYLISQKDIIIKSIKKGVHGITWLEATIGVLLALIFTIPVWPAFAILHVYDLFKKFRS
jgi:hypothetical protein